MLPYGSLCSALWIFRNVLHCPANILRIILCNLFDGAVLDAALVKQDAGYLCRADAPEEKVDCRKTVAAYQKPNLGNKLKVNR